MVGAAAAQSLRWSSDEHVVGDRPMMPTSRGMAVGTYGDPTQKRVSGGLEMWRGVCDGENAGVRPTGRAGLAAALCGEAAQPCHLGALRRGEEVGACVPATA